LIVIDPEFRNILLRVVLVGGTIIAIIAVLAVVMVGCFVLLIFSYSRR
jgi:hypothetical protein